MDRHVAKPDLAAVVLQQDSPLTILGKVFEWRKLAGCDPPNPLDGAGIVRLSSRRSASIQSAGRERRFVNYNLR
jgi:hypothetical protein